MNQVPETDIGSWEEACKPGSIPEDLIECLQITTRSKDRKRLDAISKAVKARVRDWDCTVSIPQYAEPAGLIRVLLRMYGADDTYLDAVAWMLSGLSIDVPKNTVDRVASKLNSADLDHDVLASSVEQ